MIWLIQKLKKVITLFVNCFGIVGCIWKSFLRLPKSGIRPTDVIRLTPSFLRPCTFYSSDGMFSVALYRLSMIHVNTTIIIHQSKSTEMKTKVLFHMALLLIFGNCATTKTHPPILKDYTLGEKWIWKWERVVEGEVRAQGEDMQEVVNYRGTLGLWNGVDTVQISNTLHQEQGSTPFRNWPLQVGKKWKYESEWENNEGTTGKTSQDVEITAFEELHVVAGTFKAYQIEYKGIVTNSRGFKGEMTDIWWYSPELKTYIKHVNDDGYGLYTNELTSYSKAD